ncbi:MAG: Flp pilus assembly complex ATPase component TadA [Candidatus Aenigmarchaeota archaeon]|nr:Flp pilus assembly complex ATPase component TadA [Candidatus Aenigmarchaeota archaeon]
MFIPQQLKRILISSKLLSEDKFDKLLIAANSRDIDLETYLINQKIIKQADLYEQAAKYWKIPLIKLGGKLIDSEVLKLIPESVARSQQVIAFEKDDKRLKVASLNPENLPVFESIARTTGLKIDLYLTTSKGLADVLEQYKQKLEDKVESVLNKGKETVGMLETKDIKILAQHLPIIKIVDLILEYAVRQDASDIHIEPQEHKMIVRFRVDGVLRDILTLNRSIHLGIVARIKILSELKIDEHRLPQDGRFKQMILGERLDFRVSTLPTYWGEKIVLRLLKGENALLTLKQVGFSDEHLRLVKNYISKPHGIIFVTGPTGSGKTTTLYTMVNILNTSKVNLCTVEDPVEYQIPRVNQCQANSRIGYTFSVGLRALMRQDPDIILVGEIRDNETAGIAINAAMTGHLVLTTFHTNDTVTTLVRLIDMGVPPFLIASTLNIVIAQRLVRKLCPYCRQEYQLTDDDLSEIKRQIPADAFTRLFPSNKPRPKFYRAKGCEHCNHEGCQGRVGIFEILEINDTFANLIIKRVPLEEYRLAAKQQKMVTLLEDGLAKAKQGIISIEEVLRAVRE